MARHNYQIKASPVGNEWKAVSIKDGTVIDVKWGLTRQEATEKVVLDIPEGGGRRFRKEHIVPKHTIGTIVKVTDRKTGKQFVGSSSISDLSNAYSQIEEDLPKAYFHENDTDSVANYKWSELHPFLSFVLPVLALFIPLAIILVATGVVKL